MDNKKSKAMNPKGKSTNPRSVKPKKNGNQPQGLNDSIHKCEICKASDDRLSVRCDSCHLWFHFDCAEVPSDIENQDYWFCIICRQPLSSQQIATDTDDIQVLSSEPINDQASIRSRHKSQKSHKSTSSKARRRSLELQRLEEERSLELLEQERRAKANQEYLSKKYSILEKTITDDEDDDLSLSFDDEEFKVRKGESVKQWAENVNAARQTATEEQAEETNVIDQDISTQMSSTKTNYYLLPKDIENQTDAPISATLRVPNDDNVGKSNESPSIRSSSTSTQSIIDYQKQFDIQAEVHTQSSSNYNNGRNEFIPNQQNVQTDSFDPPINGILSNQEIQSECWNAVNEIRSKFGFPPLPSDREIQEECSNFMNEDGKYGFPPNKDVQSKHLDVNEGRKLSNGTISRQHQLNQNPDVHQVQQTNLRRPSVRFENQPQQPDQLYMHINQPALIRNNNNYPINTSKPFGFSESGQPLVPNKQTYLTNSYSTVTNQGTTVYRPPVMSTSMYQSNVNYQPTASICNKTNTSAFRQAIGPSYHQPSTIGFNQPNTSNYHQSAGASGYQRMTSVNNQPNDTNYPRFGFTDNTNKRSNTHPFISSTSIPKINGQRPYTSSGMNSQRDSIGVEAFDSFDPNGMVTMQNIMSRQVIDKKLPIFSGNPEEWHSWYSRYCSTTKKCKLDHSENLDRLNKYIKGKAYDMVKSKLSQPEAVPWIIETLKKLYGKPETILKSVIKRIRKLPPLKQDDLKSLMEFAFEVQSVKTTIESSGLTNQYNNPMLMEELVGKLPGLVKLDWARYKRNHQNTSQGGNDEEIKTFIDWLDILADDISTIVEPEFEKYQKKFDRSEKRERDHDTAHVNIHIDGATKTSEPNSSTDGKFKKPSNCPTCGKECQKVENCMKFIGLALDQKWKKIKEHKICRLCLKIHKFPCKLTSVCGRDGCTTRHHQLLHNDAKNESTNSNSSSVRSTAGNNVHYEVSRQVLLKYVPVTLHKGNKSVNTIAFFDDGSQASMLEQNLADELVVKGTKEQLCLLWTDNIHRKEEAERISIEISGKDNSECRYPLNGIRAVNKLYLPPQTFKREEFVARFPYLANLPINDYENAIPGILIGSDFPKLGIQLKTVEGEDFKSLVAAKTRLGWVVYGPGDGTNDDNSVNVHRVVQICKHHNQSDDDLHQLVKEYFSIENFGVRANTKSDLESRDNERAINLLNQFTKRVDGKYETGLLWKDDSAKTRLPDSYSMALKRVISLEKQGEQMVKRIGEKIDEYVSKNYARKLSNDEVNSLSQNVWYLPVFGVVHPKKPEKLRMVFDGAAKVKSISLNSMLLTGPDELASMVDILRRLREKLIGIGADIKEMFHQVKIRKEDQYFQLFLFRNGDTSRKPDVYVMTAMVFGLKCSPAVAQFVKNTNAKQFSINHPRAVEAIIDNHYVDDMMDGENSIDSAIQLAKDVKMIHENGGFEIRNFISNSSEVLKAIGAVDDGGSKEISIATELKTERVLGMWWNTKLDVFTFSLKYTLIAKEVFDRKQMPTKRELLRTVMSIFDPLGLLSNFRIHLKILLQNVWRCGLNWDEQITQNDLVNDWKRWLQYLPLVETVQIPRLYSLKLISDKPKSVEIHTFVDASVDAFSAVSYLRIENEDGIDCALIGSKARVAPLKYLSIPRKELQAAVLGTRLSISISEAQRFKIDRRMFWSDSETVLSWLKSDHRKYSQYVAHRVGEVLESTDVNEWRWVPSKKNVADEATKWSKDFNFDSSNRWFSGPQFLRFNENEWPKKKIIQSNTEEEMKTHFTHASLVLPQVVNPERFSKWNRMVRAVGYALRYRNMIINPECKGKPLTQEEITKAENIIIRQSQFEGYPSEMVILLRNQSLPLSEQRFIEKPSPLYDGTPHLDADGILRLRGRIDGARDLSLHTKRPIVLPRDSRITRLLVQHYHAKYGHHNHGTVINEIRQTFYIPKLRIVLNKVRNGCQMCKVRLAKVMEPQMADLPPQRLATFMKPFSYVGVDYFGPMNVKIGRRREKRWGVLFTCLTIRAVHIELVSSLDTNSCIMAIGNFISDRGQVIEFHSDCGTNFVGANNELKAELKKLDPEKLKTEFTSRYTNWIFNPPSAPHMGGSWERLIRSTKSGMNFSLPTRTPNEETLRNMLKEIQNVINSRPLTFIPLEVEEDEALTPNHFLHGSSNGMKPPCAINVNGEYLRRSWKEAQRVTELFWQRFIKEYLPTITRRTKWHKPIKPLSPNDLVLVVDAKNPRNVYPRGKVLETKVGSNGQVRKAKIQLIGNAKIGSSGKISKVTKIEMWRPAHKLAMLDVLSRPEVGLARPETDRETGGRMLETNVSTDIRRSARISNESGNTKLSECQENSRKEN